MIISCAYAESILTANAKSQRPSAAFQADDHVSGEKGVKFRHSLLSPFIVEIKTADPIAFCWLLCCHIAIMTSAVDQTGGLSLSLSQLPIIAQ